MLSKWQWLLSQLTRTLWVRASLFAVLAIVTALVAIPIQNMFTGSLPYSVGSDSVGSILNILASSMLAVTTFSLSVMVTAYGAASTGATPRATQLVRQDTTTQNVLATFLGSFLYSLVGIIALSTGLYGENGRLILFLVTIAVVIIILATILRWIEHLSVLGRVGETITRTEKAVSVALQSRVENPHLGAKQLPSDWQKPSDGYCLYLPCTGYVCHIDVGQLNELASCNDIELAVLVDPGSFVHPAEAVLWCSKEISEEASAKLRAAFSIGVSRSFDQDPRFGLEVLAEIASRALSPGVNDAGTAIDVLSRSVRLLCLWKDHKCLEDDDEGIHFPNVRVAALATNDLFDDIYSPIARDGAGIVEVQLRLQKSLLALVQNDANVFHHAAVRHSELAMIYAQKYLLLPQDIERLTIISEAIKRVK